MGTKRWSRWCAIAGLVAAVTVATAATPTATPAAPAGASAQPATTAPPSPTSTPVAPPATAVQPAPAAAGAAAPAAGAAAGAAATPMTRTAYRAALDRATSDYNRKRAACGALKGNERTVCVAEAKAEATKAEAAAEAAYRNTPRARMDARVSAANADYALAKARCNDRSGSERRACQKAAKDRQAEMINAAMRAPG